MITPNDIWQKLAVLEGNLDEELARLALLRSQGKLPFPAGRKRRWRKNIRQMIDLFRSRVLDFSEGKCWEWDIADVNGYGIFSIGCSNFKAHRFSFLLFNRRDPSKYVCHHCDNRRCVNPDHLYEGTQVQNMCDCSARNRFNDRKGQKNPKTKLTDEQVREIRDSPLTYKELMKKFGITNPTIYRIWNGEGWTHLD